MPFYSPLLQHHCAHLVKADCFRYRLFRAPLENHAQFCLVSLLASYLVSVSYQVCRQVNSHVLLYVDVNMFTEGEPVVLQIVLCSTHAHCCRNMWENNNPCQRIM